jgi:hypothetical protein
MAITGTSTVLLDPIAQSFIIDDSTFVRGAFLSSVDLFFKTKPTVNIPVSISIVSTLNGYPTGEVLDYSLVSLLPADVKTSNNPQYLDSTTYTRFTFPAPVYINAAILYALRIQSNAKGYELWVAQQNDFPIASSVKLLPTDATPTNLSKIQKSPYVGSFFQSQNGITYTPDDTKDLMFTINRCVFNTAASPTINFFVPQGLSPTKRIEGNTALATTITANVEFDELNTSTTHYVPTGTNIAYTYRTTLQRDGSLTSAKSVDPGEFGTPTDNNIKLNDFNGRRILNPNINTSFYLTASLQTTDNRISPILADDGLRLYTVRNAINNLGISNGVITVANTGTGYLSGASGNISAPNIVVSAPDIPGGEQAYVTANIESGNITSVYVTTIGSGYSITPTVTITATNTTPANVVIAGETSVSGGNALARYQTYPVTLAPDNDSGDLRVFFTAYRPVNTDIHIYYKILSRSDTQIFEDGYWQKMTYVNGSNKFSVFDDQLYEFEAAPGLNNIANNFVSYTSTATGVTYNDFYKYAIKVVMSSSDPTFAPYLKDLRVIALPEGISG